MRVAKIACLALAAACVFSIRSMDAQTSFALNDGDHVVFYGDSITEQQSYTRFVELYVLTRFPERHVDFIMSGVSGDKVSGGGGGPVDQRLPRDVFDLKPTFVTVMLGMNDGYYRPYDAGVMRTYELGYAHILDEIKAHAPTAKVVVVRPSAYDEVTRPETGSKGYNNFLIKMGDSTAHMAAERGMAVVDFNAPVVAALTSAHSSDPVVADMLIADHVHPGPGIHWVMADALLKGWNASPVVTAVALDGARGTIVSAMNSSVTEVKASGKGLSWSQLDTALPLPLPKSSTEPETDLALRSSNVVQDLDQEMLKVAGLREGRYELRIDGNSVGIFSGEMLGSGINLSTLDTPMWRQSMLVFLANDGKISLDTKRNHLLRALPASQDDGSLAAVKKELQAADAKQRQIAKPIVHRYILTPLS